MAIQHGEMKEMITNFIERADKTFVRNEELTPIKEKQKSHDEIISRIAWASFFGFLSIIA